jgi:hypothetical protein
MKFLKIVLILTLIILSTSFVSDEVKKVDNISHSKNYDGYETEVYLTWTQSGAGYWTKSSGYSIYNDFDYMLTRSKYPINGYYYFDFWFKYKCLC